MINILFGMVRKLTTDKVNFNSEYFKLHLNAIYNQLIIRHAMEWHKWHIPTCYQYFGWNILFSSVWHVVSVLKQGKQFFKMQKAKEVGTTANEYGKKGNDCLL